MTILFLSLLKSILLTIRIPGYIDLTLVLMCKVLYGFRLYKDSCYRHHKKTICREMVSCPASSSLFIIIRRITSNNNNNNCFPMPHSKTNFTYNMAFNKLQIKKLMQGCCYSYLSDITQINLQQSCMERF